MTPKQDDPDQSRRFLEIAKAHKANKQVPLKEAVKKLALHATKPKRSTKA